MHIIHQYNKFSCVGACLESYLRDLGMEFSHEDFIKNNLDIFHGGDHCEGACDTNNFPEVANRLGLDFEEVKSIDLLNVIDKEGLFFFVHWNGLEGDKHFVRFSHCNGQEIVVMNPGKMDGLDVIESSWIEGIYKFRKP